MFNKVCKWCKNNWFGIAFFSFFSVATNMGLHAASGV